MYTHSLPSILLAGLLLSSSALVALEPAYEVGHSKQLFLNDQLLDLKRCENVTRTLQRPLEIRRVLKPETPAEALGFIFYSSVVDDAGTVKLFHGSYDAEKKKHFSLATSTDGLHFQRPNLGLREYHGNKDNNILPIEAVEAGVFLDPHAPLEKRYRLILTRHWPDPATAGVYVASSPDGLQWQVGEQRVLPFAPDSQHTGMWDEQLGKYVIYLRSWNPVRCVARVEVTDLESPWPYDASVEPFRVWGKDKIPTPSREIRTVMSPDEKDPENVQLYTSAAVRYPFAPGTYLAFPAAYQLFTTPMWKSRALNTNDGTFDIQFASSQDGITWERQRQPYIPAGYYDGLDLRLVSMGQGMVRRGRLIYQYFVGWPHTHGRPVVWDRDLKDRAEWLKRDLGGIYCAVQRLDGFMAMEAGTQTGTLTTRLLKVTEDSLRLNLHTDGSGSVQVAILDADGTPIPGFTLADSIAINADAISEEVHWKNNPNLKPLKDKAIHLQFTLRQAKLYAYQFLSPRNNKK